MQGNNLKIPINFVVKEEKNLCFEKNYINIYNFVDGFNCKNRFLYLLLLQNLCEF